MKTSKFVLAIENDLLIHTEYPRFFAKVDIFDPKSKIELIWSEQTGLVNKSLIAEAESFLKLTNDSINAQVDAL